MSSFKTLLLHFYSFFLLAYCESQEKCNRRQLGWVTVNNAFSDHNRITICDKRFRGGSIYKKVKKKYSQIDCYLNKQTNELYLCRFHNLYGTYLEYAETFQFNAYCVIAKETKKYLQSSIKFDDQNIQNLGHLFNLWGISIDEINPPPMYSRSYINIINQKVWYYDINAIQMCSTAIETDPMQCLSALSLAFEYQHLFKETRKNSIFYAQRFPKGLLNKDWILPYFSEIYGGQLNDIEDGDEVYIKELRINHRNPIKHSFFNMNTKLPNECKQGTSPILMDMMETTTSHWNERLSEDEKRDWLYLIDEQNSFEIYTKYACKNSHYGYFESFDARNIAFIAIANQIVDQECNVDECAGSIDVFIDEWMENDSWAMDVVIVGEPSLLSYKMQHLLFRNLNVFIGIHDPSFSVALLCMERDSFIFEMKGNGGGNIANLAAMAGKNHFSMENLKDAMNLIEIYAHGKGLTKIIIPKKL